ncbi:hypothetical protein D0B54_06980 [Solimonas sp. K1W22B-7]|uniref:hypothetical protein n=1 Tax=Solimonas sp. K1W22B-7 TaxID=2303331 RepID=UPI000E33608C|nr:hypothetical protein [Solimonas sp. K1W22B-7]AXQ28440.1 hypothetical protein D0B54_06980 [Solimonas sp. K1W22B-7]
MTPNPKPRLQALPIIALTVGLGLSAYYGEKWYLLPQYGEQDLRASVELNLALDLERRGPALQPSPEDRERLRQQIRQEIEADIARERKEATQGLISALLMLLFGGGYVGYVLTKKRHP